MKPKTIGIIGGAGPMAGAFLLQTILKFSSSLYGCYKDADFPKVLLISFPFSEMLSKTKDNAKLQQELKNCLDNLSFFGAEVVIIACNTLHAFLDPKEDQSNLIHLPKAVAGQLCTSEKPLVFCTSTSMQFALHNQFFSCTYPDNQTQKKIDALIEEILCGVEEKIIIEKLEALLKKQTAHAIVLGCTELSLFKSKLQILDKLLIDPIEIVTKKALEKSFSSPLALTKKRSK